MLVDESRIENVPSIDGIFQDWALDSHESMVRTFDECNVAQIPSQGKIQNILHCSDQKTKTLEYSLKGASVSAISTMDP